MFWRLEKKDKEPSDPRNLEADTLRYLFGGAIGRRRIVIFWRAKLGLFKNSNSFL